MLRHARPRHDASNMTPRMNRTSTPRISIETYTTYNRIPHRFLSPFKFSEVYHLRRQPRPVVAWHALESEPSPLPILVVTVVLAFFVLLLCRQLPVVFARRAKLWQWLRSLKLERSRERRAQTYQLQKYHHAVEKLNKVIQKCEALQTQLREQSGLFDRQNITLSSTSRDLELCKSQNRQLKADNDNLTTANEQFKSNNTILDRHAKQQFYEQECRLKAFEHEQESLERAVQFLETEQASITMKCEDLVRQYRRENADLKKQLLQHSATLIEQRSAHSASLSELHRQLDALRLENESLKLRLFEDGSVHDIHRNSLEKRLVEVEAGYRTSLQQVHHENASLKQQLQDQEVEHTSQRNTWLQRIALAGVDESEFKVSLFPDCSKPHLLMTIIPGQA
ncbi:hypothetical protein BC835DRAFT_582614 [Cytidiella melzeri]|nr:hypothetical protein BC835DRAFT_582614 [Cytidiella melzeri]